MHTIRIATILIATLALLPMASAQTTQSTVWLHDLTENGAYTGCHVTTEGFTTYRLTVQEGSTIQLTVRSYENNTNVHTLNVKDQQVQVGPGATQTLEIQADAAGNIPVLCDNQQDALSGSIIVRPSSAGGDADESKTVPSPSIALGLLALALVSRTLTRR